MRLTARIAAELIWHEAIVREAYRDQVALAEVEADLAGEVDLPMVAVREMVRACKPGGSLVLSVPAFPMLWGNIDEVGHHFRRYRRASLIAKVEHAGFELRFVRFFNYLLFAPIAAVRLATRLLGAGGSVESGELRSDFDLVKRGPLNDLLAWVFSLESKLLALAPPFGVSLLLVAERPKATDPSGDAR